jgi:hypothetical protein
VSYRPRIRIGHTAAPALLSRIIRGVTQATVSHSFLSFDSHDYGCEWIVEADERRGVLGRPAWRRLAYLEESLVVVQALQLTPFEEALLLSSIGCAAAGAEYDWRLNISHLFVSLGNRIVGRRRWVPALNRGDGWNCSETIATGLRSTGLVDVDPTATPGELLAAVGASPRALAEAPVDYLAMVRAQAPAVAA